ncbi:THO complex subunit 2-like isoform X1 [Clavelina lepadiformis]|uniref:THO complex subunit 2-like isoform X1 n=1 Tax=Clavelina lepadiformis TaxID=159417 RepID=UPI00404275F5
MAANSLHFQVVKLDLCKSWEKSGKAQIVSLCNEALKHKHPMLKAEKDIRRIIYEVIHQVLSGKLKTENFIALLTTLKESSEDMSSIIADVLSMIDIELGALDDKKSKEKFISLLSSCKDEVGVALLKERLDVETLESLKLINSTKLFQQKYIKTKTRLFYKQQKFNLLREEMEGYSKLAVEIGDLNGSRITAVNVLEDIKSLIGCFNIDPNRVLDLILESFECHPQFAKDLFIPLLENYLILCERSTLCHLLGFKFAHYQNSSHKTPKSLYTVAALLVHHNLISLDDLMPHLIPGDDVLKDQWEKYVGIATEEARRTTVMLLNPSEKKDDKDVKIDADPSNQKLGLCEALLRIGDWEDAEQMMEKFTFDHMISHKPIATALCGLVSYVIDPLYRKMSGETAGKSVPIQCEDHYIFPTRANECADLPEAAFPMLYRLGCKVSLDPILLIKITRIGKSFFKEYASASETDQEKLKSVYGGFLGIVSSVLLPSLSLVLSNAYLSEEIWQMIADLPYQTRYRLYGEWKNESYKKHPELLLAKAQIVDKTKYIMRRLTKENVKQTGRQMGKLSHSSPTILFDYILSQIQRYDNLILPVVDALKYLTNLTYDVLAFCIIEALANPQKERMKHDDTNISNWLQSLACFCGAIFKKYPIELSGLLQYVANQLKAGKSLDLLILKEVVQKMSGIEISEEITNDQLQALSGGEILKAEGGYFGQIRNTKKSSNRLKEALLEQNLALPLCLLMGQQRQGIVFNDEEEMHLKLVGKLTDQCHDTLVQFGNFLSIQLGTEEYVKRFPTIDILATQYHTPADVAFFLSRPMYTHQINTKYDELRKQDRAKQKGSQDKSQRYITAADSVSHPICSLVQTIHPEKIWIDLSPSFYTTFWSLTLYDIEVPTAAYEREVNKLKQAMNNSEQESSNDNRKRREKERCENLISKLKEEERKQEEYWSRVRARFKSEKDGWFLAKTTKNDTITKFLQLCIFPRSVFSSLDAVYCARFIHILHLLKTPNFSTLLCFDRIFSDISYTVASLTENEASRYGRFLCTMLEIVHKWHAEKAVYDKDCGNFPGFVTVLRASTADGSSKANQLDYENFRHVCHKWQYKLTKAIVVCLESKEFVQIRNALMILTKVLPQFPAITSLAGALEKRIDKIRTEEKEKRPDLFALAMGYSGMLKMRKPHILPEHLFHNKAPASNDKQATARSTESSEKSSSDKSSKERAKSREKSAKRKPEERKEHTPKPKEAKTANGNSRGTSKEKALAAGDAKPQSRSSSKAADDRRSMELHKVSSHNDEKSERRSNSVTHSSEREHKRRKLEAASQGKEPRVERKPKDDRQRKSVGKEVVEENGLDEQKSKKVKERKRELASPREGDGSKRPKTEGDRRSKEKSRRSDPGPVQRKEGETRKERSGKEASREYPFDVNV